MRYVVSFGLSALVAILALMQSSSSTGTAPAVQNRDAIQRLYGSPVSEVYRTSQDLTITATFASNGNVCRARIKSDGLEITDAQLNPVLDELAPKEVRGEYKMGTFLDITCLKPRKPGMSRSKSRGKAAMELVEDPCAECSGVSEDYERVTITRYGNSDEYSSVYISFKHPECHESDTEHH